MAYDATKPLDNGYLADAPAELRELFRALKEDRIVNAGALMGYPVGNASGNIPLNNGTLNTNLNADMLDGHDSAYFSAATHGHGDATTNASGFMSATDKTKLNGIATGAEVNQNAFSNVTVGNSTIQADSKTDTLTLVAGTGITLTADTTNDKVTIKVTDNTYAAASHTHNYVPRSGGTMTGNLTVTGLEATGNVSEASAADSSIKIKKANTSTAPNNGVVLEYSMASGWVGQLYLGDNATIGLYWNGWSNGTRGEWKRIAFASEIPAAYVHPTTAGYKHIPSGGADDQYLKYSASGTAVWADAMTLNTAQNVTASKTASGGDVGWDATYNNKRIRFIVGPSGINRGIWDTTLNKWIFHCDDSKCYVGGYSIEASVPSAGVAPKPTTSSGVGQVLKVSQGSAYTLPSGGTWLVYLLTHKYDSDYMDAAKVGFYSGGSKFAFESGQNYVSGLVWRIA
ncbi:MAG: hypothetical protein J6S60_06710 [Oscillospiraceae bacterium]|nr:hypothetical protein [Oscillospiraceae bacterium]